MTFAEKFIFVEISISVVGLQLSELFAPGHKSFFVAEITFTVLRSFLIFTLCTFFFFLVAEGCC